MSIPITYCDIRKALDKKDWTQIDRAMEYNRKWGAFSILPCHGHLFKKKCKINKDEEEIVRKHI